VLLLSEEEVMKNKQERRCSYTPRHPLIASIKILDRFDLQTLEIFQEKGAQDPQLEIPENEEH
jgi:hypothetical protein